MKIVSAIFALLLSAAAVSASAAPLLEPYTAEYTVHLNGFKIGELTRKLEPGANGTWVLENTMYTTGLASVFKKDRVTETSVWKPGEENPIPLTYKAHYTGRSKDVTEGLTFDWDRGIVTSLRDGKETAVPLHKGVLDKLMYQIVLRHDLARGRKDISYEVADRGKIENYEFEVLGKEKLVTVLGELDTIKVRKGTTTFWCAVELDYLLVQLVQEEDSHKVASYITDMKKLPR